jgi:phosphatidylserine decarboxylase
MVKDGYYYGVGFLAAAIALGWVVSVWLSVPCVLLAAFFLWFFRDPVRIIPSGSGLVVSPGDGVVTEAARIQTAAGERQRISIFLSVFNVHVNRSPIAGTVTEVRYRKGLYLNAMNPASAERNEQNSVTVRGEDGVEVTFRQIAGLLARRIVFHPKEGDRLECGERVGLIKFGSRVDVILPADAELLVQPRVRVKGGSSVLARLPGASK